MCEESEGGRRGDGRGMWREGWVQARATDMVDSGHVCKTSRTSSSCVFETVGRGGHNQPKGLTCRGPREQRLVKTACWKFSWLVNHIPASSPMQQSETSQESFDPRVGP